MESILILGSLGEPVKKAWEQLGYEAIYYKADIKLQSISFFREIITANIEEKEIQYVFSFNFNSNIAEVAYELNVIYISWTFDSPLISLWSKEVNYSTNRIFVFDYFLYERLVERKLKNVFYLPLATDVDGFINIIQEVEQKEAEKYITDVSFVGNLYNNDSHDLYSQIAYLPPYVRGEIDAIVSAQRNIWGVNLLDYVFTDDLWFEIKKYVNFQYSDRYVDDYYEMTFKSILGQHITKLERMELCSCLSELFQFRLYTDCSTDFNKNVKNMGHADYYNQMPLIFHYSKININITLRTIESGISLRVLDVLACEGFLLTNYQPEIAEYFEDGKELVVYSDYEDMCEKIEYYLNHEDERKSIAHAGFVKVRELFTYEKQIQTIEKIIKGEK